MVGRARGREVRKKEWRLCVCGKKHYQRTHQPTQNRNRKPKTHTVRGMSISEYVQNTPPRMEVSRESERARVICALLIIIIIEGGMIEGHPRTPETRERPTRGALDISIRAQIHTYRR